MRGTLTACAVILAGAATGIDAQQPAPRDYPVKPIRFVVPYAPGGTMDFIGHHLGQKIAPAIGQNFFIDNRPGAGGAIGTDAVAKAAPDGYTILVTSSAHAMLPSIAKALPYDAVRDLAPIALVARSVGSLLVVHPSVPARSVGEFIALAKAHPGKLNYGSGGVGSVTHFGPESFNLAAGIRMTHVPYKGIGQAIIDIIAGRVEASVISATVVLSPVRTGKLRALGITAPVRWSELPDVPTLAEAGLPGYSYVLWYGLWFPSGTPAEYGARMRAELTRAFEDPALKRVFAEQGLLSTVSTAQEFAKVIADDIDFNRRLVARIGLAAQ